MTSLQYLIEIIGRFLKDDLALCSVDVGKEVHVPINTSKIVVSVEKLDFFIGFGTLEKGESMKCTEFLT